MILIGEYHDIDINIIDICDVAGLNCNPYFWFISATNLAKRMNYFIAENSFNSSDRSLYVATY